MNTAGMRWIFLIACFVTYLKDGYGNVYDRAKIVTYGEPCVAPRQLPIKLEGPRPPPVDEKIPLSLDLKVVSDIFVQPRRKEFPIKIEVPETKSSLCEEMIIKDNLRGMAYSYNTYVPNAANPPPPPKNYNFGVDMPISVKDLTDQECGTKVVERLKGLKSRIDRVLVPACEVSSSPYKC